MSNRNSLTITRPDGLFFVADTHFWHKKAAEMRGFESVEEMNEALINRKTRSSDYHKEVT